MRSTILPKTTLGRWSVGLAVAWILFFIISEVLVGFEVLGAESNHALALTLTVIVTAIGGATFVTGLISIIKSKERSVLVFLTTAIGLYGLIGLVSLFAALAE